MKRHLIALTVVAVAVSGGAAVATGSAAHAQGGCHSAYIDCVPADHDVDCGADKLPPIRLRQIGVDPYRLDANKDGIGCNDGPGGGGIPTTVPSPSSVPPSTGVPAAVTPTTRAPAKGPAVVKVSPRFTG